MTAPSSEATPRPWEVFQLDLDNWGVCEIDKPVHGYFATERDAEYVVTAVNSYDESRKLLRQAVLVLAGECDMATEATLLARITAHLEAGK